MAVKEDRLTLPMATPKPSNDALLQAALTCKTPAQMARLFELPDRRVADLLRDRLGVRVSRGAAHGGTYTWRDRLVFDTEVKQKLYEQLRIEFGAEHLEKATHRLNWFDTAGGQGLEALVGLVDLELGHDSYLQQPIRKFDHVMMLAGLIGAAVVAGFTLGILYPVFYVAKRSWTRWREAKADRPTAAIVIGYLTSPLTFVFLIPYVLVASIRRLAFVLRTRRATAAPAT